MAAVARAPEPAHAFCPFCKKNGELEAYYRSHKLKDENNQVVCPVLSAYTCPKCGVTGAHTAGYCPRNQVRSTRRKRASTDSKKAKPASSPTITSASGAQQEPKQASPNQLLHQPAYYQLRDQQLLQHLQPGLLKFINRQQQQQQQLAHNIPLPSPCTSVGLAAAPQTPSATPAPSRPLGVQSITKRTKDHQDFWQPSMHTDCYTSLGSLDEVQLAKVAAYAAFGELLIELAFRRDFQGAPVVA